MNTLQHTVLIIEDNEQNLYLSTFMLEQKGFKVVAARSGPEGITMADKVQVDLILIDIQLPGIDGYTVTRELRKKQALKDIPIVAVTSYAMVGDKERAIEAGCTGYIEKPINPDTFMSEIEKYLKVRAPDKGDQK